MAIDTVEAKQNVSVTDRNECNGASNCFLCAFVYFWQRYTDRRGAIVTACIVYTVEQAANPSNEWEKSKKTNRPLEYLCSLSIVDASYTSVVR